MTDLPMPPANEHAIVGGRYFKLIWDTTDVPPVQQIEHLGHPAVLITPQHGRLTIYGRFAASPYAEDRRVELRDLHNGRIHGEWFSTVCPQGELGTQPLSELTVISAEEFSEAYQRNWDPGEAE